MRLAGGLALITLATGALASGVSHPPAAQGRDHAAHSAGERAFQKCYACHSLEGPDPALQGPALNRIIGRAVAAEAGFDYSPAMRAYAARQGHWTRAALDAFLADPQGVVPETAMGFYGIRRPEERAALIEYLAATSAD